LRHHTRKQGSTGRRRARDPLTIAGRRLFDERIDLAAEILSRGSAFVADDAPALYRSLERLARHRGVGMWCGDLTDPR